MPEVQAIAVVALAHGARLEPARDVVFGDPDLIVAVGQVGRVDRAQVVGEVLADREPRARDRLRWRSSCGSMRTVAQAGGALEAAAELRADAAGQIGQHLLARDFVLFAAHLVERAAGDEQRHDVRLGQRRIRRQRRLGVARRSRDREGDVVVAGRRVQQQVERRDDAALVDERDHAALDFVAALVERDLAALEQRQAAGQARLVRRAEHAQVGRDLGLREVVVDEDRRRGVDVDVEADALEQRVASSVRSSCRRARDRRSRPVSKLMSPVRPASSIVTCRRRTNVVAAAAQTDGGVRQAAQIERRVEGEVVRRELELDIRDAAVAKRDEAGPVERAAVERRRETRERDARPARSTRPVTFSAATLGSSTAKVASVRSTKPFSSGAFTVPRADTCSVVSPSARTASVNSEIDSDVEIAVQRRHRSRGADEPDSAGGRECSNRSGQTQRRRRGAPPAMRMVDGCCCARVRPLKASCKSGNVIRPSSAARSARAARHLRIDADASREPGRRAGDLRQDRDPRRCRERRGAALPRNLDWQRWQQLRAECVPPPSSRATPQLAFRLLDVGLAVRDLRAQVDVRTVPAGCPA